MTLVPSLIEPARRFPAALILALLDDTGSVASRLISLKQLFPSADVFRIVSKRLKSFSRAPLSFCMQIPLNLTEVSIK